MQEDKNEPTPTNDETVPKREITEAARAHPTLLAQPRHNVSGGTCIDVDSEDGTETWHMGRQKFDCPKCPGDQYRWHDMYLEVAQAGDSNLIMATAMKVCVDCNLETEGKTEVVGSVEAPNAATQNRAARRAREAAARKGRKR